MIVLSSSCTGKSNKEQRVLNTEDIEGCFYPIYIRATNQQCRDTVWLCFDINNFSDDFCLKRVNPDNFSKSLINKICNNEPIAIPDSMWNKYYPNDTVKFITEVHDYYLKHGLDSMLHKYDLNKYGQNEFDTVMYIGLLLWQNDLLISFDHDEGLWY